MTIKLPIILSLLILSTGCNNEPNTNFQNKGHKLVYEMVQKVGTYEELLNKKDVVYTYTYETPDGKTDISTEKYIFDGELSYGAYSTHERTLTHLEGLIEQGFDGNEYWLKNNSKEVTDSADLKRVAFNRPTNFYWFTMMQKLLDPGLNYEYLGEKMINEKGYHVVKITFNSEGHKPTDIYQVYINQSTSKVDQFLFTVVDYGVVDTPFLMKLEYENVDGIGIPTKRRYKKSDWNAKVTDAPWIKVDWSDIKFNNNLDKEDFTK